MEEKKDSNTERIYTKEFSVCLVFLIISVLLSFYNVFELISGQIEAKEETIIGVVFLCCLLIGPATIWLIYLIVKKKVFYMAPILDLPDENSKGKKKTVLAANQDIVEMNYYVEQFEKNKKIVTFCKNYADKIVASFPVLEYIFVPMIYIPFLSNRYRISVGKNIISNNDFLKQICLYNQEVLNNNPSLVMYAHTLLYNQHYYEYGLSNYVIRGGEKKKYIQDNFARRESKMNKNTRIFTDLFVDLENEINDINSLFKSLIKQKILECQDGINAYRAFLYLLYKYKKMSVYEESISIFEGVGIIPDESNIKATIEKLLDSDIEDPLLISNLIRSLYSKRNNFIDLFFNSKTEFDNNIQSVINTIKENQKVEELLKPNKKRARFNIADIDLMSGEQFESFVTYLFNELGYNATNTKLSGDQGIDVIATKGKTKVAIQAKCYSKPVGNHAIMEAVAGAKHYGADKVMVVTNNYFTKSAKELAESNNVILWDRNILKEKMEQI